MLKPSSVRRNRTDLVEALGLEIIGVYGILRKLVNAAGRGGRFRA
jgi:hypothetical protein